MNEAAAPEPFRRVLSVQVWSLFGLYDHKIELNHAERVTIIHGPNGVGKTVLLRLVASLFGGRYAEISAVPFKKLTVMLDGNASIEIARRDPPDEPRKRVRNPVYPLDVVITDGLVTSSHAIGEPHDFDIHAARVAREVPFLTRVGASTWQDDRDDELLTADEVVERYGGRIARRGGQSEEPDELKRLRSSVQTHVIEAQRLIQLEDLDKYGRRTPVQMTSTVQQYSRELRQKVLEATASYAGQSQGLDQTFPRRLMALHKDLSPAELRTQLDGLDKATSTLSEMGLLAATQSYPVSIGELDSLDDAQRRVMTLYVQDTARKLGVLSELAGRIQLLLESVNGKFRNKAVRVSREEGFVVRGLSGENISVEALSSGEQHELVLLYDLLFRVQPNTLVLIDEPELSLHVTWQKKFLPELLAIIEKAKFDAIVATHSPFIVGDRYDLMSALDADPDFVEPENDNSFRPSR